MGDPSAIDRLLEQARSRLDRVQPAVLASEMAHGAVVIDIRPVEQRARDGELPGAVVVDRNVLEWRLDPGSAHRLALAVDSEVRFIVVCNQGYSSSLAAATLRDLGLRRATDLVGGFEAWAALQAATAVTGSAREGTSFEARRARAGPRPESAGHPAPRQRT